MKKLTSIILIIVIIFFALFSAYAYKVNRAQMNELEFLVTGK